MRRIRSLGWVMAILVFLVLVAANATGCGGTATTTTASTAGGDTTATTAESSTTTAGGDSAGAQVLKVGVLADFSFPLDVDFMKELDVLVKDTNAQGGLEIGGERYQVEIVKYDSKGSPETGRSAVQRLITQDKVDFILGDGTADGWLPVTESAKKLVVVASPSPNVVTPQYQYVFQAAPFTTQPAMAWGWITDNLPEVKTISGAFPDNIAGHGEEGHLRGLSAAFGHKVLATEFYPTDTTDFSAIATKLIDSKPDACTTAAGGPVADPLYYKALRDRGFTGAFVSYTTITSDQIAKVIPIDLVEGMTSAVAAIDLPEPTPTAQKLRDLWVAEYGEWTNPACTGIQTWYLLVAGLQQAGSTDVQKVADTIAGGIEFDAAIGAGKTVPRPDVGNTRSVDAMYYTYMGRIEGGKTAVVGEVDFTQGQKYLDRAFSKPPAQ